MNRLFKVEVYKFLHQKRLFFVVLGLAAFAFLLQVGFRYQGRNPLAGIARRMELDPFLVLNAVNTTRLILNSCYYLFLPILTAMIFAGQIAGERSGGTLWAILTRPVSRTQLFVTKFIVATLALLVVVLFFVLFTLGVGVAFFGTHDFLSSPRVFDLMQLNRSAILSFEEGFYRLLLSGVLLTFLLLPTAAFGFYASILFHHTHSAMAATLLVFFGCYVLQGLGNISWLPLFYNLKPYLFTTAMEAWIFVFYPEIAWDEIIPRVVVLLVYIVALLTAGAIHFRYIDLND